MSRVVGTLVFFIERDRSDSVEGKGVWGGGGGVPTGVSRSI